MSHNQSPANYEAASAASPPSSPQHLPDELPHGVGAVDAVQESPELARSSPDRSEAEQQPPIDGAALEEGSDYSDDGDDEENPEYVEVDLQEIRKILECPICLGIIKNTRTMTECLHRFCKECIDKAMRMGKNECPACRIHVASRRSFRDDPDHDKLIAAFFPDIDKYEEEEMSFCDEDKSRNEQIQASIAETARRQSEAMPKRRSSKTSTEGPSSSELHMNNRGASSRSSNSGRTTKRRKTEANDAEKSCDAPEIAADAENQLRAVDKSPVGSHANQDTLQLPPTVGGEDISSRVVDEEALPMSEGRKTLTEFGPNCNHWHANRRICSEEGCEKGDFFYVYK